MSPADEIRSSLDRAQSVCVLTGAGISAESGVPTFRGAGGLWKGSRAEQLATPQGFAHDPELVWKWYDWRRQKLAEAKPNAGHLALAELQLRSARDGRLWTLVTQNVDGLHDLAAEALPEQDAIAAPLKLHGDIWTLRCTGCEAERVDRCVPLPQLPPYCACGHMERPGVVWFGEPLPLGTWTEAESASAMADLFLVIGTSAVVYPAAGLAHIAQACGGHGKGAKIVEINPEETALSGSVDVAWRAPAAEALPRLL